MNKKKKVLIWFLCAALTVSNISMMSYASEITENPENVTELTEDLSDSILQEGGLLDSETTISQSTATFYTTKKSIPVNEINASLKNAFDSFATECDLSKFKITPNEFSAVYSEFLNTNPRYFYVYGGYRYYYSSSTGCIVKILISYNYNESTARKMLNEYDLAIDKALAGTTSTWSEMEKALYINDYLTRNCGYDLTYSNYDAYDVLVSKTAVCQGYALAYIALADKLGLDCEIVTSDSLNHAWNLVAVNDNLYHVDATWNDPINDRLGRSRHVYFMKSTSYFQSSEGGHLAKNDWVISGGWEKESASNTGYDKYFWNAIDVGFDYVDGDWYGFDGINEFAKYSCNGSEFVKISSIEKITDIWYAINQSGYWPGKYVGTGSYDGLVYFSTSHVICVWNPKTEKLYKVFELSPEQMLSGYIYSLNVDSEGNVYYLFSSSPNNSGTVYKADIEINMDEKEPLIECYVSQNGDDNNTGSPDKPVKTLRKALNLIEKHGTIYLCDDLTVEADASNDPIFIIDVPVTIQAMAGNQVTLYLQADGILLVSDAAFVNVDIVTDSHESPIIAANGHKLELMNDNQNVSLPLLQIYGGSFIDHETYEDGRGLGSEINLIQGNYGAVYAANVKGLKPDDESKLSIAVNINMRNSSMVNVVDGVREDNTVNLTLENTGACSFDVKKLDTLKIKGGTFVPSQNSVLGNDGINQPNIILEGAAGKEAILDLSDFVSPSKEIQFNDFEGTSDSILVLNKTHILKLHGVLDGTAIEFRLSGGVPWKNAEQPGYSGIMEYGKTYISGGTGTGSFVISHPHTSQPELRFIENSSAANGWTTIEDPKPVEIVYTITYYLNNGKNNSSNPLKYTNLTEAITLKDPTRTGYKFAGWYSDLQCSKKITTISKENTGNITLYAKWAANSYKISFDGNGSKNGSMSEISCEYGNSYALNENMFKKTGYVFNGWNTRPDGSGIAYKDRASVKNLTSADGKIIKLYAQWKSKNYEITYVLNGGKNSSSNPASYNSASTLRLQNPTKIGYAFKGWYSDSKYKNQVLSIKEGTTGNVTLYAKWVRK